MHLMVLSANWFSFNLSFHLTLLLLIPCVPQLGRMITNHLKEFWSDNQQYDVSGMSVKQLKTILDRRGEMYQSRGLEKIDLVKLVQKSVHDQALTDDEYVLSPDGPSRKTEDDPGRFAPRKFHSKLEIEKNKNSVWLIQTDILEEELGGGLDGNSEWSVLLEDVLAAGIQLGTTSCSVISIYASSFCTREDETLFILAIPTEKELTHLYSYNGVVTPYEVYKWIHGILKFSVHRIGSLSELVNDWIKFQPNVRTLNRCALFSNTDITPLLYNVLGVQMRDRLKFGMMVVGEGTSKSIQGAGLDLTWLPAYVIFTPNGVYRYGRNIGETEDEETMQVFFRMLSPRAEDVFQFSFIIILHSILCLHIVHWMPSLCLFIGFCVFWSVGAIISSTTHVVAMLGYLSYLWQIHLDHPNFVLIRFALQWYMSFTGYTGCASYYLIVIATGALSSWLAKQIVIKLENRD